MTSMAAAYKSLTSRELQVSDLITNGLSYTEIGEELMLSPYTVKTHYRSIYQKLGIHSKRELFALKKNITEK